MRLFLLYQRLFITLSFINHNQQELFDQVRPSHVWTSNNLPWIWHIKGFIALLFICFMFFKWFGAKQMRQSWVKIKTPLQFLIHVQRLLWCSDIGQYIYGSPIVLQQMLHSEVWRAHFFLFISILWSSVIKTWIEFMLFKWRCEKN